MARRYPQLQKVLQGKNLPLFIIYTQKIVAEFLRTLALRILPPRDGW
jgi:hypothetical protein